ncbi:magnesium transporter CorA family protein [Aquabacterium sp.]|uniref:magnesium transporter CorA family protein n=1 Tax=Aquabacterium sp. TaxID=1872578 RepID=UPI002E32FEA2|nr:magnesium transporter CorA family protein [Aquabacterium sp.]HEX5311443.1 magnesium transporter CorA family protein [Aquabacterium sp.]
MRFFLINDRFTELDGWPEKLPATGFLWVTTARRRFEVALPEVQQALLRLAGGGLVDLHVSDLLNSQLPSQYDYTSWYDLLVFRRLAAGHGSERLFLDEEKGTVSSARQAIAAIDTSPVGFAVFDRILLTVHPADCSVRDFFEGRLAQMVNQSLRVEPSVSRARNDADFDMDPNAGPDSGADASGPPRHEGRGSTSRLPPSPADLMLRIINHMVDSYLDLRRLLTRQFGYLQQELLTSSRRFTNWQALLESRNALHLLEDTCEDQRSAVQEWIDALDEWPMPAEPGPAREREVLRVRSRDVLEHIERVLGHVRRLESSAESAVQMHFSAQGSRTNDIMRTLTVLTAIFLPLNLITGVFGMNFDSLPLIHQRTGFWVAISMMVAVVATLVWLFHRKRYLDD